MAAIVQKNSHSKAIPSFGKPVKTTSKGDRRYDNDADFPSRRLTPPQDRRILNLKRNHPEIHTQSTECSADRGYDSAANNAALYDEHNIKPVIDTRQLWKNKTHETLFPNKYDVFSYDEKGRIFCTCPSEKQNENETCQTDQMRSLVAPIEAAA
jgi:hypothetical protein